MDRLVREKETSVAKVRESGLERERALQSTVRELSKRVEDLQGALRQSQWTQQDTQKENEATVERYATTVCLLCYRPQTKLREGIYAEACLCSRGGLRGTMWPLSMMATYPPPHPILRDMGPRYLPPATDTWWSSLETCSNLFTWGPTPIVLTPSGGHWNMYSWQACDTHPTEMLYCWWLVSGSFWLFAPKFWEVMVTYELIFCAKRNADSVVLTIWCGGDTQTLLDGKKKIELYTLTGGGDKIFLIFPSFQALALVLSVLPIRATW